MAKKKNENTHKVEFEEGREEVFLAITYFIQKIVIGKNLIEDYLEYFVEEKQEEKLNEIKQNIILVKNYTDCVLINHTVELVQEKELEEEEEINIEGSPFENYRYHYPHFGEMIESPSGKRLVKIMMDREELHIYYPNTEDDPDKKIMKERFVDIVLENISLEKPKIVNYSIYRKLYFSYRGSAAFQEMLPHHLKEMLKLHVAIGESLNGFSANEYENFGADEKTELVWHLYSRFSYYFEELYKGEIQRCIVLRILVGFVLSEMNIGPPMSRQKHIDSKGAKNWYNYLSDYVDNHLKRNPFYEKRQLEEVFNFHCFLDLDVNNW